MTKTTTLSASIKKGSCVCVREREREQRAFFLERIELAEEELGEREESLQKK
jgi:hypothetical protein